MGVLVLTFAEAGQQINYHNGYSLGEKDPWYGETRADVVAFASVALGRLTHTLIPVVYR